MKKLEDNIFILNPKADYSSLLAGLTTRVNKLIAMAFVVSSGDFVDYEPHQIHNYFSAVQSFSEEICEINKALQERYLENFPIKK